MKIRNGKYGRKAISPIIATVLIIAVTLIAAVAIGGFVFGIFGSASSSAQVAVTATDLIGATFVTTGATTFTCGASAHSYITLTNTGTAAATVVGVTITFGGVSNPFAPTVVGNCPVGAAGAATAVTSILLGAAPDLAGTGAVLPVVGQTFTGTVTMSNGADLLFTGTWQ